MAASAPVLGGMVAGDKYSVFFRLVVLASAAALTINGGSAASGANNGSFGVGTNISGLAIGTALSFTFVAANWAGEIIGQQMGFNLSEVFDPQFGAAGAQPAEVFAQALRQVAENMLPPSDAERRNERDAHPRPIRAERRRADPSRRRRPRPARRSGP